MWGAPGVVAASDGSGLDQGGMVGVAGGELILLPPWASGGGAEESRMARRVRQGALAGRGLERKPPSL